MWYAVSSPERRKGSAVSALSDYIKYRMKVLGKQQNEVAADAGITESTLSNILNPNKKKKSATVPRPETIKGLAKALDIEGALLTALLGYPIGPTENADRYDEIAHRLSGVPWLADRLPDLMDLPEEHFQELMKLVDFRRWQDSANQPKP